MRDEMVDWLEEAGPEDPRLPDQGGLACLLAEREAEDELTPRLRQSPALARILLVEDERGVREAVATFLAEQGYDVVTAADGRGGLDLLRGGPAFDLVVLDIRMPGVNGWEFRAEQKADASLAEIPVVVLTGDGSAQARAIDADALLEKPVIPAQLLATVRRLLFAQGTMRRERAREETALGAMGRVLSRLGDEMRPCVGAALDAVELARHELEGLGGRGSPRADEAQRAVLRILGASALEMRRLRRLVGNLRAPKLPGPRMGRVDLNAVLAESERLMAPEIETRAHFLSRHVPLPPIRGDASSLCQVFLNLLQNAVDAIPLSIERDHQISFVSGLDGPNILVEVADTGVGVPSDLMGDLFRLGEQGQAGGRRPALGLPVAQQIVTEHGGTLTLESRVGRGTWARVTLPQAPDFAGEDRVDGETSATGDQGAAPILLVEDPAAQPMAVAWNDVEPRVDLVRVHGLDALRTLLGEGFRFELILCDISVIAPAVKSVREEVNQLAPGQWEQVVVLASDPTSPQALSYGSFLRCLVIARPQDAGTLSTLVERLMERRRKMLC